MTDSKSFLGSICRKYFRSLVGGGTRLLLQIDIMFSHGVGVQMGSLDMVILLTGKCIYSKHNVLIG